MDSFVSRAESCCAVVVKLDHTHALVVTELGQGQLGLKKIAIGIQRVQLRVDASPIPNICKAVAIFEALTSFSSVFNEVRMRARRLGKLEQRFHTTDKPRERVIVDSYKAGPPTLAGSEWPAT